MGCEVVPVQLCIMVWGVHGVGFSGHCCCGGWQLLGVRCMFAVCTLVMCVLGCHRVLGDASSALWSPAVCQLSKFRCVLEMCTPSAAAVLGVEMCLQPGSRSSKALWVGPRLASSVSLVACCGCLLFYIFLQQQIGALPVHTVNTCGLWAAGCAAMYVSLLLTLDNNQLLTAWPLCYSW